MVNDDWGFKTQTMLSPTDMRRFVFPWHQRMVELIPASGRQAILHSCGYMKDVWNDIIDVMRFDGKHSYEDLIQPVEVAYEEFHGRVAILGGIDVDFLCRATAEQVYSRCRDMIERSRDRGGYALGAGNSITSYLPPENYFAMAKAAWDG